MHICIQFMSPTRRVASVPALYYKAYLKSFAGFSSVIPGFPRYSVIGERKNGVYNLRISNASLEDDAEYQCQVGPSKLNKAIRANAKLNVICKYLVFYTFVVLVFIVSEA